MGNITQLDEFDRLRICVKTHPLSSDEYAAVHVDVLMDEIEQFTKDLTDECIVVVEGDSNLYLSAYRFETDEELTKRINDRLEHAKKVQKSADDSWARQKRKFANAKKRQLRKAHKKQKALDV